MPCVVNRVAFGAALLTSSLLTGGLSGQAARAECALPPRAPQMPQGATATDEEMKQGHDALQKYVDLLEQYEACVDAELNAAPPDMKPEDRARLSAKADAAIEAAHEIADVYAIQLRAFKARQ